MFLSQQEYDDVIALLEGKRNKSPLLKELADWAKCSYIVKKYDDFNVFPQGANCVFTSRQTLNEKYGGSMFYYTR